jgi:hypothetical protein
VFLADRDAERIPRLDCGSWFGEREAGHALSFLGKCELK